MKKHIVCFGDSNTHGYRADPNDCADGGDRFNENERWTCLLQKSLGDEYIRSAGRLVCSLFEHSPVYRTGGDEFVAVLTGRDYEDREAIMRALHDRSVVNIGKGKVVVSGGLAEYAPGQTPNCHAVFEAADARMYEEKKLLKSLGAATRL